VGTGSIDFGSFASDATLSSETTAIGSLFFSASNFEEFLAYDTATGLVLESLVVSTASYDFSGLPSLDNFGSVDLGMNGAGIELRGIAAHSNNFINLVGGIAQNDGFISTGVQNYDFTITDLDGDFSGYVDGHVIFDSNGALAGGEQVLINVVPEPTALSLFGLGGCAFIARRRRA